MQYQMVAQCEKIICRSVFRMPGNHFPNLYYITENNVWQYNSGCFLNNFLYRNIC